MKWGGVHGCVAHKVEDGVENEEVDYRRHLRSEIGEGESAHPDEVDPAVVAEGSDEEETAGESVANPVEEEVIEDEGEEDEEEEDEVGGQVTYKQPVVERG